MLYHACEGIQGESHEDISSTQLEHCYLGVTHVKILGTLSINYLADGNFVPMKLQQILGIFEYVK
jgi:hypothetical protein